MKPVYQDIFYAEDEHGNTIERGNCRSACIASILEIDLAEVPYFVQYGDRWEFKQHEFLVERGLRAKFHRGDCPPQGYAVAVGLSPRSSKHKKLYHAVVALDGQIVHDPHPDNTGILGPVEYYHAIVPLEVGNE